MDEKGAALGGAGKARVICPKSNFQVYKTQDGNREWVSLIECISADGRILAPFIIFKGKRHMKAWYDVLEDEDSHIALAVNIRCSDTSTAVTLFGPANPVLSPIPNVRQSRFSTRSKLTLLLRLSTIACTSSATFGLHLLLFVPYLHENGH